MFALTRPLARHNKVRFSEGFLVFLKYEFSGFLSPLSSRYKTKNCVQNSVHRDLGEKMGL